MFQSIYSKKKAAPSLSAATSAATMKTQARQQNALVGKFAVPHLSLPPAVLPRTWIGWGS